MVVGTYVATGVRRNVSDGGTVLAMLETIIALPPQPVHGIENVGRLPAFDSMIACHGEFRMPH